MTRPTTSSSSPNPAFDRRLFLGAAAASAALALPISSGLSAGRAHADPLPPTPPRTDFITWHEVGLLGVSPVASALMTDPSGAVWYADATNLTLVRIEPATGGTTEFTTGVVTTSMVTTPGGLVWLNSAWSSSVGVLEPATGHLDWFSVPTIAPNLAVGSDGSVWLTDPSDGGVATIDASGAVSVFTAPGSPDVEFIAGAADGSIWFSASGSGDLSRLDPATGVFSAVPTAASGITGLTATPAGPVWAGSPNSLLQFTPSGTALSTLALPPGSPRMLVAGVHAELYFRVTDRGIGRVNSDHSVTFMLPPFERAAPMGLAVTPAGSVWFLHRFRETLGWF